MDRAIDPVFAAAQKRRRMIVGALVIGGLFLAFTYGPSLLKPSVPRSRVRVEKVNRGPVEASISANGTVTPDLEEVISSPVDARVTRILKRAGDPIKAESQDSSGRNNANASTPADGASPRIQMYQIGRAHV